MLRFDKMQKKAIRKLKVLGCAPAGGVGACTRPQLDVEMTSLQLVWVITTSKKSAKHIFSQDTRSKHRKCQGRTEELTIAREGYVAQGSLRGSRGWASVPLFLFSPFRCVVHQSMTRGSREQQMNVFQATWQATSISWLFTWDSLLGHRTGSPAICGVAPFRVTICLGTHTEVHGSDLQAWSEESVPNHHRPGKSLPNSQARCLMPVCLSTYKPCPFPFYVPAFCLIHLWMLVWALLQTHSQIHWYTAAFWYHVLCYF